jgi:hypothetical protein
MHVRIALAAAAVLVAGCQQKAELKADGAWLRLPAVTGNPGAAYFTVHGGSEPAALLAVGVPFAARSELHESMAGDHGSMAMKPLEQVAVPARGEVKFAPGGRHLMVYDIAPKVQPGTRVPLTLAFADGKRIEVQAVVVAAGDPEPRR